MSGLRRASGTLTVQNTDDLDGNSQRLYGLLASDHRSSWLYGLGVGTVSFRPRQRCRCRFWGLGGSPPGLRRRQQPNGLSMIALAAYFDRRRAQLWPRVAPPDQRSALCRAVLETRLGWLVVASCSNACVLLMPLHAADPPDLLEVTQAMTAPAKGAEKKALPQAFPMEEFLDRLMAAESGGRLDAKNPRSTALGPFQFIESTFLFVVNKYFPSEVASLTREQVLALRTDMAFSRRAAGAYSNHLISALNNEGLPETTVNVRLAFLVGPDAAVRLLKAPPDLPLTSVLSAEAIAANPYMSGATIANLVRKAAADMSGTEPTAAEAALMREAAAAAAALKREAATAAAALKREAAAAAAASKREAAATAAALKREAAAAAAALKREAAAAAAASKREATATAAALKREAAAAAAASKREAAAAAAALKREAAAAAVSKREAAAATAALRDVPAATVAPSKGEPTATTPSKPPFQIKCEIGLASCRKWVALQERKARLLVRSAQW